MSRANAGTKGVPRIDREAQILRAAGEVFGAEGFAGSSVAVIAERVGISKPLVYQYFGSKEGLFSACLGQSSDVLVGDMERVASGDAVGLERGLATLSGLFHVLEDQPWLWRLFFDATAPRSGAIADELADYTKRITDLALEGVGELMASAGTDSQKEGDPLDVDAMAAVWMSIVDALVMWWLDHPGQSADEMTQRCVRLLTAATRINLSEDS